MTHDTGWDTGGARRRVPWRGAVLVVAGVVAVAALAGAWWVLRGQGRILTVEETTGQLPTPPASASQATPLPGSWQPMAISPLDGRTLAAMAWTGDEAVLWGGLAREPLADGAAYDPVANQWRTLPPSPLSARFGHAAVWNGREVVIAGGMASPADDGARRPDLVDAAAFDPGSGRWRMLPPLPFPTGAGHLFSAEGRVFAVSTEVRALSVVVLEPGAGQWAGLVVPRPGGTKGESKGPVRAGLVHGELVLWNPRGDGPGAVVDTRRPSRWRPLERSREPLPIGDVCCVLVASEGASPGVDVIVYDRAGDAWHPLGQDAAAALATNDEQIFLVRPGTAGITIGRDSAGPRLLPPPPLRATSGAVAAWAGDRLLLWGGATPTAGFSSSGAAFVPTDS